VVAGVAYSVLPTSLGTAAFLSEEEKEFALMRLQGSQGDDRFK
jgi:hypothetical protein